MGFMGIMRGIGLRGMGCVRCQIVGVWVVEVDGDVSEDDGRRGDIRTRVDRGVVMLFDFGLRVVSTSIATVATTTTTVSAPY
jgi:hypothetical protein